MLMSHRRCWALALAMLSWLPFLLFVAGANAQPTPPPYDPATVPPPVQTPIAALGATLYAENCAPCHGPTGNSDGPTVSGLPAPPPKFADPATTWLRSPAEYFHITKFGRIQNLMPPWGNRLNDEQIWQSVYYAWSLHTDQSKVQNGQQLYEQNCASCHGLTGAGDGPEATGALPNFADSAAMIIRTDADLAAGWQNAHPALGEGWSEAERRNALDYIRTFSYSPPWVSALQPGEGVLNGQVVQGTTRGGAVASLPVTLTAYVNFAPAQTFTTTTDEAGAFQFTGLATDEGVAYIANAAYAGILYNSDIYQLSQLTPTLAITVPVYETTDDSSGIHINRANWLVDFTPGAIRVGIILVFSNQLDRTFVGSMVEGVNSPATVALYAPPGASEIEFEDGVLGGRYQQVGERIYDIAPIAPGAESRQIVYSYLFPYTGTATELEHNFIYPAGSLNLLVSELPGLEVEAASLNFVGVETIQEVNFRHWASENLSNPVVRIGFRGLLPPDATDPRAPTSAAPGAETEKSHSSLQVAALALGGVVFVLLAGALYLPWQRGAMKQRSATLEEQKAALIEQIAGLDDQHAGGLLATPAWAQERARLKSALLAVAQELAVKQGDRMTR